MHRTWLVTVAVLLACDPSIMVVSEDVYSAPPSLAVSPSGETVVAYMFDEPDEVRVSLFDGSRWKPLCDPIPLGPGVDSDPQIVFQPDGTLLLKSKAEGSAITVRRWTGTAWELVGGPDGPLGTDPNIRRMRMALDSVGTPVVAAEIHHDGSPPTISLRRWDGATWAPFASDDFSPANMEANLADFVLDSADRPVVLLEPIYSATNQTHEIGRWDGGSWQLLSQGPLIPDLGVDSSGAPLVLNVSEAVTLMSFDGASWTSSPSTKGVDGNSTLGSWYASLANDASGGVFAAWQEKPAGSDTYGIYVKRWTGEAWEPVLGPINPGHGKWVYNVQMAFGGASAAKPAVAWIEEESPIGGVYYYSLVVRVPR